MWTWNDGTELYHYGVKGMKWGVRRTKEELSRDYFSVYSRANRKIIKNPYKTSTGILVKEFSQHAAKQSAGRDNGKSPIITPEQVYSTLTKPVYVDKITVQSDGRRSQKSIGRKATVCINPDTGTVSTVFHTGSYSLKRAKRKASGK